jgi:hypothetical protein
MKTNSLGPLAFAVVVGAGIGFLGTRSSQIESVPGQVQAPAAAFEAMNPKLAEAVQTAPADSPERPKPNLPEQAFGANPVIDLLELPTDFLQTEALYVLVGQADIPTLKQYIQQSKRIPKSSDRGAAQGIIYLRFSDLDPEGALTHLYQSSISERSNILYGMFGSWAKLDLDAAIARIGLLKNAQDRQVAGNAIAQALAENDPSILDRIAAQLPDTDNIDYFKVRALLARARIDPAAAMEAATGLLDRNIRYQTMMQIASLWAKTDANAALAYASQIDDRNIRTSYRRAIFQSILQDNPEAMSSLLRKYEQFDDQQAIVGAAMTGFAATNPERGLALAQGLKNIQLRRHAINLLIQSWTSHDPKGAASALSQIDDPTARQQLGMNIALEMARSDPAAALQWAEEFEGKRGNIWENVLRNMGHQNPDRALAILNNMEPSPQRNEALGQVLASIARSRPWLAATYLEEMPPGPPRDQALWQIAQSWGRNDPAAALEWVLSQDLPQQSHVISSLAFQMASQDLQQAIEFTDLMTGQARIGWISAVVGNYATQNPQEAANWVAQFSDEASYGDWMGMIAGNLVLTDPQAALNLISSVSQPDQYLMAAHAMANAWANQDAAAAAQWVAGLPDDQINRQLVSTIASNWYRYDPQAARNWVLQLERGESRDQGIMTMLNQSQSDPAFSASLINQIGSDSLRNIAASNYIQQLAGHDLSAAQQLLDSVTISTDQRSQLQQIINNHQPPGG